MPQGSIASRDLEPRLLGEAFQVLVEDYALFCAVRVDEDAGTIAWPNGADFSPQMLYAQSKAVMPA